MGLFSWVGDVVNAVGDFLSDPLGFRNIGKNIPQSFSLEHNINLQGKIEATVNVTGHVKVVVEMPDLVKAANAIREGLVGFDLTGGALRQLISMYSASLRQRQSLLELQRILALGATDDTDSSFHLEFSMVNDSTVPATTGRNEGQFTVIKRAQCSATVEVNGKKLLDNAFFAIPSTLTGVTVPNPPRIEHSSLITNIKDTNTVSVSIGDFGEPDTFKPCKIQVRIIKATSYWRYTVYESIIDGEAGKIDTTATWLVNHATHKAVPKPNSDKAKEITTKLSDLTLELARPPAVAGASIAEVAVALVKATGEKVNKTEAVSKLLSSFGAEKSDSFDVRTPFMAAVTNHSGAALEVNVEVVNSTSVTLINGSKLGPHDEMAVAVPFEANFSSSLNPVKRSVRFKVKAVERTAIYTATLHSGHEWGSSIVQTKSGLIGTTEESFEIPVVIVDNLAS